MNPLIFAALFLCAPPEAPKGHLVAVGGGGTGPAIVKRTIELAGGPKARVVVVPQASQSPDAGKGSADLWREAGAVTVNVLSLDDKDKAVGLIKHADLIWMGGGDQNRLMKLLADTGVPEAIRERYRAGAVVGGTSAGAAVLSGVMITGDADLKVVQPGATKTDAGLDLWAGAIVDQHFLRRQRFNRLLGAVLDKPQLIGIGVDEATAAVLTGGKLEVVGMSQVLVIDARGAKTQVATARDVKLHLLKEGMTLDLAPAK